VILLAASAIGILLVGFFIGQWAERLASAREREREFRQLWNGLIETRSRIGTLRAAISKQVDAGQRRQGIDSFWSIYLRIVRDELLAIERGEPYGRSHGRAEGLLPRVDGAAAPEALEGDHGESPAQHP